MCASPSVYGYAITQSFPLCGQIELGSNRIATLRYENNLVGFQWVNKLQTSKFNSTKVLISTNVKPVSWLNEFVRIYFELPVDTILWAVNACDGAHISNNRLIRCKSDQGPFGLQIRTTTTTTTRTHVVRSVCCYN